MRRAADLTPLDVAARLRAALQERPRRIPSSYFYDPLGSALFEAICRLPWYPIARAETALLECCGADIAERAGRPLRLIELGPGGGEKLDTFVNAAGLTHGLTVHLVDVSSAALETAQNRLRAHPDLVTRLHEAEYEAGLRAAIGESSGRALALFLGSNIGNFDPPSSARFLRAVRDALQLGDALLLGADLVKPAGALRMAYDDPLGVTAAFNRNVLHRLNREYDASFDISRFAHRAIWNAVESRVEMHLVSHGRQTVVVPGIELTFTLEDGETIWTESSYKFEPGEIAARLTQAGFAIAGQWIDEADRFALTLARAAQLT